MEAHRCPGSGVVFGVKAVHVFRAAVSGISCPALAGALFETKGYALLATEA